MKLIFFILFIFPIYSFESATAIDLNDFTGKVVRIIDGDSFELLLKGNTTIKIRLNGIDCPERGQDYYSVAKDGLAGLIFQKEVRIVKSGSDRYKRIIADVYLPNGQFVNELMIAKGWAWHYKKYSADKRLAEIELKVRKSKLGLWERSDAIPPWDFRKKRK